MTSIVVEARRKRRRNKKTCTNHKKWRKTNDDDVAKITFATDMLNIDSISNQSAFTVWIIVYCFEEEKNEREKKQKNEKRIWQLGGHTKRTWYALRINRENFLLKIELIEKIISKQKWRPEKRSVHKTMADFWRRFHHFLI